MTEIITLETDRLILRQWKAEDFPLFAELNSDPEVMEFFPNILSTAESDKMAHKIQALIAEHGWGFWAVEVKENQPFIGFVGLHEPHYELPFTPCVEIGWRLSKAHWGKGYASEAAKVALDFGFSVLNLTKIYSFTPVANARSRAVMQRLKMYNMHQNFEHPLVPSGNSLREHVLYKITKDQWEDTGLE